LKKRTKKLPPLGAQPIGGGTNQMEQVFWFFFSKKNRFLASPRQHAFISIQDPFDLIV
jgi:hypothetical protein